MSPIQQHPQNPHYFLFRGKPAFLLTSAEHYGAVLNPDFDYTIYLATLQKAGMNYTRIFTGAYCEDPKSFNIQHNTLAPKPGKLLCPWKRSTTPGYANGGNKFDLTQWDQAYFARLHAFVAEAGKRGIVVEISLFCPFYDASMWKISPMNAENNVNGVGKCGKDDVYNGTQRDLLEIQLAMTTKIATELKDTDNVFYEICNEPYFGGVTLDWQQTVAQSLTKTEKAHGNPHLVAQNIANGSEEVKAPFPEVAILNFHYASPPDAVEVNFGLNRVIGFDETGFRGITDAPYRMDAWDFLLAGGGLYNHLDYSFSPAHPDGTEPIAEPTPGGGGQMLRAQFRILHDFMAKLDYLHMVPNDTVIRSGPKAGITVRAFVKEGRDYVVYVRGGSEITLTLALPQGEFLAEWTDTKTGKVVQSKRVKNEGEKTTISSPSYTEDIVLRVTRR